VKGSQIHSWENIFNGWLKESTSECNKIPADRFMKQMVFLQQQRNKILCHFKTKS